MWEFHAAQLEEKRQIEHTLTLFKSGAKCLRETLIGVLGLRFKTKKQSAKIADLEKAMYEVPESTDDAVEPFVPMSYLVASPELLDAAIKSANAEEATKDIKLEDAGDMEPIFSFLEDKKIADPEKERSDELERIRQELGIGIWEPQPDNPPPTVLTPKTVKLPEDFELLPDLSIIIGSDD